MMINIIALIISLGAISISIIDAVVCMRCMDKTVESIDSMIDTFGQEEKR